MLNKTKSKFITLLVIFQVFTSLPHLIIFYFSESLVSCVLCSLHSLELMGEIAAVNSLTCPVPQVPGNIFGLRKRHI